MEWIEENASKPAPAAGAMEDLSSLISNIPATTGVPAIGVLLIEYPGYGRSGGSPSQESITATMLSAHDFLTRQSDVDRDRLVAYGRSLGGGAACALMTRRPIAALVLESSFTSVPAMAARFAIPGALVVDRFDNLSVVESAEIPMLVLHGEHDRIIPVSHGEALARAAGTQLVRMPCGHNDCPRPWGAILKFLVEHGIVERGSIPSRFLGS